MNQSLSHLLGLSLLLVLASCQTAARRPDAAEAAAVTSINETTLFEQGLVAHRNGDSTRAEQYFAAAIEKGYPAQKALPLLVAACLQSERFDTALYYARAHLSRHANDAQLRYLVATLHFAMGQDDRARGQLDQVIVLAPRLPEAHYLLGLLAYERLRDGKLARRSFQRYLALAPLGVHSAEVKTLLERPLLRKHP